MVLGVYMALGDIHLPICNSCRKTVNDFASSLFFHRSILLVELFLFLQTQPTRLPRKLTPPTVAVTPVKTIKLPYPLPYAKPN